jgi:hypothetical protein
MFVTVILMWVTVYIDSVIMFFVTIILLLVSVAWLAVALIVDLFLEDKRLDVIALQQQGYTLVMCTNCETANILEDQYCRNCGEVLKQKEDVSDSKNE